MEQAICRGNADCNAEANMMSKGVSMFGCGPYQVIPNLRASEA